MNIRTKLTLRFILINAIIIMLGSVLIYVSSADYREENFYTRLKNKAENTAKLLIEVEEVSPTLLRKLEQDNPVSLPGEKIIVYNHYDSVLFTTDEEQALSINKSRIDQIRLEDEIRWRQGDYEVLGFLFKGKYDRFVVVTAANDIFGFNKLTNLLFILLLVFALSIVIVSISGWFFAGRAVEPIAKVVNQVSEISITRLNLRVDEGNGKDEISKLAQTFNVMLSKLEASFLTQKNFIANASHELRTPLTAITGQLEVTLLNNRSTDEYKNVINSVLDDIKNLNNLSNRLLILAQSSSEEREKAMRPLRIDEAVWQTKEELVKHQPEFVINIDLDENLDDESKLTIRGDEQLIRVALMNIIENGCKYSKSHTIDVLIEPSYFGLTLVFKDSGIGIPPSEIANIFEPFYRGTNTKNIKGHGIGLSMAQGIVKLHRGAIELISKEGVGTTITMSLPTANQF
jgi:signal transduction histidine kinase